MSNYHECQGQVRSAGKDIFAIGGVGDLVLHFPSEQDMETVLLRDMAHVPTLGHHLLSLKVTADEGHEDGWK